MQTDPGSPVKTGYVKVLDNKGNIKQLFRYDELYMNVRKRQEAAYLAAVNRGCIACCCKHTKIVKINIERNGAVTFPDISLHSLGCVSFLNEMRSYIAETPLQAFLEGLPVEVSFNWEKPPELLTTAVISSFEIARKRKLSFSQWLVINNAIAFSGNRSFPLDAESMCGIFTDWIDRQMIGRNSKGSRISVRTREDFLFRDGMEADTTGFYYGKILDIPAKYNSGKGKNLYIIVSRMKAGGNLRNRRDIFLRVPKEKFLSALEALPDKKNAYISGFVKVRDVVLDAAEKKFTLSGPLNPGKTGLSGESKEKNKKRIFEMRFGCLFTALDNGLIVFTKEEYEAGQKAVREKRICYRHIFETRRVELSLMAENENGEDEKLW